MPTVSKTFSFLADTEGLADAGVSANIAFAANTGDGNPADSVKFTCLVDSLTAEVERALRASTGQTWETWGVPVGATVTAVRITSFDHKYKVPISATAQITGRVVNSSGNTVHSAGDLINEGPISGVNAIGWASVTSGSSRAVDASWQASTTDVRLELQVTLDTGSPTDINIRLDTIVLEITYSAAVSDLTAALNPVLPETPRRRPARRDLLKNFFSLPVVPVYNWLGWHPDRIKRKKRPRAEMTVIHMVPLTSLTFTVTPSHRSTYPGVISGLFTITLDFTPGANEVLTLSDNSGGGTIYPGTSITIPAGSRTATFSYFHDTPGIYTITVTDVTSGLGAQSVTVYVGDPDGLDIRVYDRDNKRKAISENAIFQCDFEVLERGGYGHGSFSALAQWDDQTTIFTGTERVDIWYRGAFAYRGYLKVADRSMDEGGEYSSPTLYGLMEALDKIVCDRKYVYGSPVDISVIAQAIIDNFVLVTDGATTSPVITSPPLPHDLTTDIQTVGIEISQFDTRGMTVTQALSSLCDAAPFAAVWGCGVDNTAPIPADQVYFRPRSTAIGYRVSIGGAVADKEHSSDTSGVVNKIRIIGGPLSQPNLVADGSFEDPSPASELVGNLLSDYSFETGSPWSGSGGATRKAENAHTGTYSYELDTAGEKVETSGFISISQQQEYTMSCWARCEAGVGPHYILMAVDGYTSGGVYVPGATFLRTESVSSTSYVRRTLTEVNFSAYPTVAKVKVRIETDIDVSVGDGVNIDDVGFFETQGIANPAWRYALAGAAVRDYVDWQYVDPFNRWHGAYAVKAKVSGISSGSDYMEIRTDTQARFQLVAGRSYTMLFRYQDATAADVVKAAIAQYGADGTLISTTVSTDGSNASAQWNSYVFTFTASANAAAGEFIIRLTGNTVVVLDGCMLIEGALPSEAYLMKSYPADPLDTSNPLFWPGDRYEATITTDDYRLQDSAFTGGTVLSADTETSIDDYGLREPNGPITNEAVVDELSLLAFAVGYFNGNAVPIDQGAVTVLDPDELIKPDALVRILNLRFPPDALHPSRCVTKYEQGGFVRQTVDMGSERADMTGFLKLTARRAREGFRYGP